VRFSLLARRAATEFDRSRPVDDEADPRIKLAWMPLDFRHQSAGLLRLMAEAGKVAAHPVRRSTDRALEQVSNLVSSRRTIFWDRTAWRDEGKVKSL